MTSLRDKPKKKPPKDSLTLLPCFYFVELPIVASSMVSLYILELTDLLQPALVGFRCHDHTLSMPFVDGGDELIPLLMLLSLAFAGPAASIMIGEGLVYCMQSRLKIRPGEEGSINAGGCNFNSFLRRTVRFVGVHVFGLCATALLTDVIQLATGYHSPFFLTVCKPNYTLPGVACEKNPYITRDICSGHDQHAILTARKTFPSQHATLSAFSAVYISMYFNATISDSTKLLKPLLVFAFSIMAALTGLTQITQYRSHPIDVYTGFLIGAGIAAYLAVHAVGNFQSPEDAAPPAPPPAQKDDALRALTQRGHDSVYNKGPASASDSNDEIAAGGPPPLDVLEGLGRPPRRERASAGSPKRSSVDVELLAPRSPMGKETMVTFSSTLPRASVNVDCELAAAAGGPGEPAKLAATPAQRRLKAVQVPMDPTRSQQLVSEWKQKSLEMRGAGLRDRREGGAGEEEEGSEAGEEEEAGVRCPSYPPTPTVQPPREAPAAHGQPPGGARAAAAVPPRPPHIPEAGPPPVSPKSALTRAKWLSIAEKSGRGGAPRGAPTNQPRIAQVAAMAKERGLIRPYDTDADSSHYCPPSEQQRQSVVSVDAHASHHPVVHAAPHVPPPPPPPSSNGNPWERRAASDAGGSARHARERDSLGRDRGGPEVRPQPQPRPHADPPPGGRSHEPTFRCKTPFALSERDIQIQMEQEHYYKNLQEGRRYKE